MKIVKYFITTVLAVWTAILMIIAYQNRESNKIYKKLKGLI